MFSPTYCVLRHRVLSNGSASDVDFFHGVVILEPANVPFVRGDANADGTVTGLVDGFFVLLYQFVPGSPPGRQPAVQQGGSDGEYKTYTGHVDRAVMHPSFSIGHYVSHAEPAAMPAAPFLSNVTVW